MGALSALASPRASNRRAAFSTLPFNRAHSEAGALGRETHRARHAASEDWPYMKPRSWVSVRVTWEAIGAVQRCARAVHAWSPVSSMNSVGARTPGECPCPQLLAMRGVHLHDYGKRARQGRKVGHCTVVEPTAARRDARARRLLEELAVDLRIP